MKKTLFAILFTLGLTAAAEAQSPVTTLSWDYNGTIVSEVATYGQLVTIDNTPLPAVPSCSQVGANVTCTVPAPALATGTHTVSVEATKNGISAKTIINGLGIGANAPKNPTNFKLGVVITVNLP